MPWWCRKGLWVAMINTKNKWKGWWCSKNHIGGCGARDRRSLQLGRIGFHYCFNGQWLQPRPHSYGWCTLSWKRWQSWWLYWGKWGGWFSPHHSRGACHIFRRGGIFWQRWYIQKVKGIRNTQAISCLRYRRCLPAMGSLNIRNMLDDLERYWHEAGGGGVKLSHVYVNKYPLPSISNSSRIHTKRSFGTYTWKVPNDRH